MKLQGILADLPTPFDYKGDIYKSKIEHNVEKWNRAPLAGYVVLGAASETESLSEEEKRTVLELVAKHAAPGKVLLAGSAVEGAADLGYAPADGSALPVKATGLWSSLKSGASAVALSFAAAAPYTCIMIWDAFRTREEEAGLDWQARIDHAAELIETWGLPALKRAMDLNGYFGGRTRQPATLTAAQLHEIDGAFRDLKG